MNQTNALVVTCYLTLTVLGAETSFPTLEVPSQATHLSVPLPPDTRLDLTKRWALAETAGQGSSIPIDLVSALRPDGVPAADGMLLVASLPPAPASADTRRFRLVQAEGRAVASPDLFRFREIDDKSLGLWEGDRPVLVYNHGIMSKPGVPADRHRSTYVHPIYGLDGEVLTDDFPADHLHHRGLFWAWPHVRIAGQNYDLWDLRGIAQRFERWLDRKTGDQTTMLGVENGWFVGEKKVMQERVWFTVFRASRDERIIDVRCTWIPLDQPVTLAGAEGKSYGGMTLRFAPRTNTVITTPLGNKPDDLAMTRLPWADFSALFAGAAAPSGIGLFIAPDHPDFPPTWLTRHYGALCVGWPGVNGATFPAGQPIQCNYRVRVHRQLATSDELGRAYQEYEDQRNVKWSTVSIP